MNRIPFILIAALLIVGPNLYAQNFTDAVSYLDFVGKQYSAISADMMSYMSAVNHGKSAGKVEKRRAELMQTVKDAETNMRKLKPFKGDASLRDTVAAYFRLNRLVLSEDYGKIVNLEEVAEQSYDKMEAYMLTREKADEKLDQAFEKADKEYDAFAERNKIRLIEGSTKQSKKMEQGNKVMKYYNLIYLIFFKSYKDEAYLMDAYKKGDVSAIEQTKNALQSSASDGLKKMSPVGAFETDKSLKVACEKMLEYYKFESSDKTNELTDFFLKKEKYEQAKKAMDAKRGGARTQADVDSFNKLVEEYNASVNKANKMNADLDKKRSDLLNTWNRASSNFLDDHYPKF